MSKRVTIVVGGMPKSVDPSELEQTEVRDRNGKALMCWDIVGYDGSYHVLIDVAFDDDLVKLATVPELVRARFVQLLKRGVDVTQEGNVT